MTELSKGFLEDRKNALEDAFFKNQERALKDKLRAIGMTVFDPELDMITQGGGGIHCMCQSLIRDPG